MAEAENEPDLSNIPEPAQEDIREALRLNSELQAAQARVDALLAARKVKVLSAKAKGVSAYRMAPLFGVSQTAVGNWLN